MNVGLSAEVRYHWFREHLVVVGDWHRLSPSERDRLRHQPMPDEAAQSLRVDLSPWSCGMVFSEPARRRPDPLRPLLPGSE